MDIEHFISIEQLLSKYLIFDIIKIIIEYLNISFENIINNHIKSQNKLINIISLELKAEFEIEDHIEFEIFNICDHLPRWEHPIFIDITFDYCPKIDLPINISYKNYLWEILEIPEPIYYTDSDL